MSRPCVTAKRVMISRACNARPYDCKGSVCFVPKSLRNDRGFLHALRLVEMTARPTLQYRRGGLKCPPAGNGEACCDFASVHAPTTVKETYAMIPKSRRCNTVGAD